MADTSSASQQQRDRSSSRGRNQSERSSSHDAEQRRDRSRSGNRNGSHENDSTASSYSGHSTDALDWPAVGTGNNPHQGPYQHGGQVRSTNPNLGHVPHQNQNQHEKPLNPNGQPSDQEGQYYQQKGYSSRGGHPNSSQREGQQRRPYRGGYPGNSSMGGYPGNSSRGGYPGNSHGGGQQGYSNLGNQQDNSNWRNQQDNSKWGNQGGQPYRQNSSGGYWDDDPDVFLSKTLSSILRHNAEKFKLNLQKGGFIYVDEILQKVHKLRSYKQDDVIRIVDSNDKKRFALQKDERGQLMIRANQGHTMQIDDLDLRPLTSPDDVPCAIHGTYYESWESIKRTGLSRMKRNHIHMALGDPGSNGVISGMRSSCEITIRIDLKKAMEDGIKFFRSANNVILSPGNDNGFIPPEYFYLVMDRKKGAKVPIDLPSGKKEDSQTDKKKKKKNKKNKDEKSDDQQTPVNWEDEDKTDKLIGPEPENASSRKRPASDQQPIELSKEKGHSDSGTKAEIRRPQDKLIGPEPENASSRKRPASDQQPIELSKEKGHSDSGTKAEIRRPQETVRDVPLAKKEDESPLKSDDEPWSEPVVIDDTEVSKCSMDDVISKSAKPNGHITVVCCGEKLGSEASKFRLIAVFSRPDIFIYHLTDENQDLVRDGDVLKLLRSKSVKVLHNVRETSFGLLREYDVLLDGTPVWDISMMYEKVTLTKMDQELLKEEFHFTPKMFKSWAVENEEWAKKLNENVIEQVVKRGKLMDKLFTLCISHINTPELNKKIKGAVYHAANPSKNDDKDLQEKFERLRLERQKQQKEEKAAAKPEAPKQEQAYQSKQNQGKHGKGAKKNKKK